MGNTFIGCSFGPGATNPLADVINDNFVPIYNGSGDPTINCQPVVDVANPVQRNVLVQGNTFVQDQGQYAVYAFSTDVLDIVDNFISANPAPPQNLNFGGLACSNVQTANNTCDNGSQNGNCSAFL